MRDLTFYVAMSILSLALATVLVVADTISFGAALFFGGSGILCFIIAYRRPNRGS